MKILLIGSLCDDKWIGSLIKNLKANTNIEIDFFHVSTLNKNFSDASQLCNNVYSAKRYFPSFLYKIPKLGLLLSLVDVPISLNKFLKSKANERFYDIINIHYPQNKVLRCWKNLKHITKATVITPWGSEVLRISTFAQKIKANYITHYDYVMSSDNPRFKSQMQSILHIPEEKFLQCDFGSEMIDELCNSTISKLEAKSHFGIGNQYTIVCGYNAGIAQNHIKIIDAIAQVKDKLPKNIMIVLPMTYNINHSYMAEVERKLVGYKLDYIILKKYLSNADMVCLRKCADMFVHAQNTDANSVSLAEHLLCDNVVVNASWLRYENREIWGVPYYLFNTFEELPGTIENAYKGGPIVPEQLKKSIASEGWNSVINKWINIFTTISKDKK